MNKKHTGFFRLITGGAVFALSTQLQAQHYPAGSEGIRAGSLPLPGIYAEDYNAFYFYNHEPGVDDAFTHTRGFNYVQTPRLKWVSGWKILGANYAADLRVPIGSIQLTQGFLMPLRGSNHGVPASSTVTQLGLEDIQVEPLALAWHWKHFDLSTGYSFWAPTGDYDPVRPQLDNLGQGYWTHSLMLGVTWFPDAAKTWAFSLLNHYDFNLSQKSVAVNLGGSNHGPEYQYFEKTPGDVYTLECSASKVVMKNVDAGVSGYYQAQVTDTEGPYISQLAGQSHAFRVAGIGPEITLDSVKWGLSAAFRYDYEFSAAYHPQGHLLNLIITKSF